MKELVSHLQTVAVMLAIIPIEEFEQHVRECQGSLSAADSIGVMIDPTGWMRANADGSMEDARHQLTIAQHLLEARRAIDVREAHVKEVSTRLNSDPDARAAATALYDAIESHVNSDSV